MRLTLEPVRADGPILELAAVLEHPAGERQRLWWRLPAEWRDAVTPWADPFVIAFLFPIMQWQRDVIVEGTVSPSLLANLEQYMALWRAWRPDLYQPVDIRAREETEAPAPSVAGQAIAPLSCGVDSSFTVFRHTRRLAGRQSRPIGATIVLHGFDITLEQENSNGMYEGLLADARAMARSLDLPCVPITANLHELPTIWYHSFGTFLNSALRLLSARFDVALFPNDVPYTRMQVAWGSHPVSNPLLSSRHFQVIDDGPETTRFEKIQLLAQWPEAMRHLHVCLVNWGSHANCCRCEKCIRTILSFRVAGVDLPPTFERDVKAWQIRRTHLHSEQSARRWMEIIRGAQQHGLGTPDWVKAMHTAIRLNRIRWKYKQMKLPFIPLRNRLRGLFRGSPLSRRQSTGRECNAASRTGVSAPAPSRPT
ncbi:MAG: hypothetical protein JW993_20640 [Sedimentisphaerales bacterium]|nr:hypothetical protein [Sedimentisphaerales bacterium]